MTGMIASSYLNTKTPFFHAILLAFFPFRFLLYSTKRCAGSLQLCIELYCIQLYCFKFNHIVSYYILFESLSSLDGAHDGDEERGGGHRR